MQARLSDFVMYLTVISDFQWLMNAKDIHVPIGIPLDDQKKVVDHLLNILIHLHEIIDIVVIYRSSLARRDLDNSDTFYEF